MKVQYDEGPAALTVPAAGGVVARRGEPIDVPAEVGKALIDQGWKQAGKETSKEKN